MPFKEDGTYWADVRDGLATNNTINCTPMFGQWSAGFSNEELIKVIECLENKAFLVEDGLDTYNDAEKFAYAILFKQWEYLNGKFPEVKKLMEEKYAPGRSD